MRWRYWLSLVTVSVLLHLALFWPTPDFRPQAPGGGVLAARLSPQPRQEVLPAASGSGKSFDGARSDTPVPVRPRPEAAAGRSGAPAAMRNPPAADPTPVAADGAPALPEASRKSFNGSDAFDERPHAAGSDAGAVSSMSRYRFALAAAAVRLQSLEGDTGAVAGTVVVEVYLSGGAAKVQLAESSGVDALDKKALALFARAVRVVPAPGVASDSPVRLPVVFSPADS